MPSNVEIYKKLGSRSVQCALHMPVTLIEIYGYTADCTVMHFLCAVHLPAAAVSGWVEVVHTGGRWGMHQSRPGL